MMIDITTINFFLCVSVAINLYVTVEIVRFIIRAINNKVLRQGGAYADRINTGGQSPAGERFLKPVDNSKQLTIKNKARREHENVYKKY